MADETVLDPETLENESEITTALAEIAEVHYVLAVAEQQHRLKPSTLDRSDLLTRTRALLARRMEIRAGR